MSKTLNAFMTMVVDQAIQLAKTDEEANRRPTELAQRIAIGMIQARSQECRHFAGKLLIDGHRFLERFPPGPMREGAAQMMAALSVHQRERSKKLEDLGNKLVKWPPTGEDFPPEEEKLVEVVH